MNRTCLSIRIDVPTPTHKALVISHFHQKAYASYVLYLEEDPKHHYHIRIESMLTRQALHNKLKKLYQELKLKPSQHSHHVVWQTIKGEVRYCKKHTDCVMGSFTYVSKMCKLIQSHGVAPELINKIQQIGRSRLLESKLPTYKKIALIYNLDQYSTETKIIKSVEAYYNETDTIPPYNSRPLLHKLMCHIGYNKYKSFYYRRLLQEIKQNDPSFY